MDGRGARLVDADDRLGRRDRAAGYGGRPIASHAPAQHPARAGAQPAPLRPFLPWATAVALDGALDRRHCELLALRAAWNCRSDFEWGHHVDYAQAFGLSDDEIARVPHGPDADGWTPEQVALLRAADELHTSTNVSDETWSQLAKAFDPAQLVEIVMTVGQYTMLSMVANTFEVEVEEGLDPLPVVP